MASIYDGMSGPLPFLNQAIPSLTQPGLYDVTGGFGSQFHQGIAPPPPNFIDRSPLPTPKFSGDYTTFPVTPMGRELPVDWNNPIPNFNPNFNPNFGSQSLQLSGSPTPNFNANQTTLSQRTDRGSDRAINVDNLTPFGPRNANQTTFPQQTDTGSERARNVANLTPVGPRTPPPVPPQGSTPPAGGTTPFAPNQFEQAWLDQNKGNWGADVMNFMMGGGGSNFKFDPVNINWANFSNGRPENITQALGNLQQGGGDQLAKMLGGTFVDSPFAKFGTQQRDKYIKMPNGQMIEASAFANSLQGASKSSNPSSSIADVIGLYQRENQSFDSKTNTDAVNLAMTGQINTGNSPNWDPSKFAGGNPTFTPSGPVPGNPSNPGMGTSNPVPFQNTGGLFNPPALTIPSSPVATAPTIPSSPAAPAPSGGNNNAGLPPAPTGGTNNPGLYNPPAPSGGNNNAGLPPVPSGGNNNAGLPPALTIPSSPAPTAPNGVNLNSNYFLPQGMGLQGLGNQIGNSQAGSFGGGGGGATINRASGGGRVGAVGDSLPFAQARPTSAWAGNLPSGAKILGK